MALRPHRLVIAALLPAAVLITACEKEDDPAEPEATADVAPIDGPAKVVMTVNGNSVTVEAGGGNAEIIQSLITGGPPPATSSAVFVAGFHNGADTLFRLRTGSLEFTASVPSNAELQSYFAPGPRSFANIPPGGDGLEIEWHDASGAVFSTACGPISGSFEITDVASQQTGSELYVKFRALFSGTLPACDGSGGSVTVTDGVLVLRVNDDE